MTTHVEVTTLTTVEMLSAEHDATFVGEVVRFGEDGTLVIDADTPALGAKGLAEVESVQRRPGDGFYLVRFTDGTSAVVDLDGQRVSFSAGDHTQAQLHGALYAALGQRARFADDDETLMHLADAQENFESNPNDPEALKLFAQAARDALAQRDGEIQVNPADMQASARNDADRMLPRAARRARSDAAKEMLANAVKRFGPQQAPYALLNMASDGSSAGPAADEIERRKQAAARLGGEHLIPETQIVLDENGKSIGEYELGETEHLYLQLFRNRTDVGQRFFILRGPPGSGKDTFVQQIAALRNAPHVAFNIGPHYSIEDALGADGLEVAAIKDDKGNIVGSGTSSVQLEGPLARALQEDCVVVIQEPAGMEGEMVRLHSAAGDNVGDPTKRYLNINSAKGEVSIEVHPECLLFLTYNSGAEDSRFGTALHDRAGNFDFEYPTQEAEARRLSKMVTKMMANADSAPELKREYEPEELMAMVKVIEAAREAHIQKPDVFVDVPGARQAAHCFCDLLLQGYSGDPDPANAMQSNLRYLLPGSENMSMQERDDRLREVLGSDNYTALNDIAKAAREQRQGS